jgi:F-type H+-transporting ATPase subunit delta
MNPALEGYTAAVFESVAPEDRAALASDVEAVDRLVRDTDQLRVALSDTAVSPRARRAILSELLEGRVDTPARQLCAFAVFAVGAPEVTIALEWVSHRARNNAEDRPLTLATLGHHAARRRVGGYAAAVFEDSTTGQLEEIEDQVFRFVRIVESTPPLLRVLSDRDVPVARRQGIVDDLLVGKADDTTVRLVRFVITGGRSRDLIGTLDWLVEQAASARGWRVARVTSADEIDQRQRERLAETLSGWTSGPVELQVTVDPTLLGGIVIEIGDLQVDSSARSKIDRLREQMAHSGAALNAHRTDDQARGATS